MASTRVSISKSAPSSIALKLKATRDDLSRKFDTDRNALKAAAAARQSRAMACDATRAFKNAAPTERKRFRENDIYESSRVDILRAGVLGENSIPQKKSTEGILKRLRPVSTRSCPSVASADAVAFAARVKKMPLGSIARL
jgi:hypothetical protein